MKVLERVPSRERCAESGWYAYDLLLDAPMDDAFIRALRPLGGFTYLSMLAQPFFKVESDYYMIKGLKGNDYLRLALHDAHRGEMERIVAFIEGTGDRNSG